jgi:hypothetical protein
LIARFPRAKGEAVLKAVIERAHQINANPELCCYIKQLRLFGSMLDPSIPISQTVFREMPHPVLDF